MKVKRDSREEQEFGEVRAQPKKARKRGGRWHGRRKGCSRGSGRDMFELVMKREGKKGGLKVEWETLS